MRYSLVLGAIALTIANGTMLATARPADARGVNFSKVSISLDFRPGLLAKAKVLAVSAGLSVPASVVNPVKLNGTAVVDTTSKIATITIKESVSVVVKGLTVTGNSCVISNTSSTTAVLSCMVGAAPRFQPTLVPLIKFTGDSTTLLKTTLPYSASSVAMEVPEDLATLVNRLAKKRILTAGQPLGTASGTAQF
jgi:hypothetical protein